MNQKPVKGLLKHIDFIIMDLVMMQVCFVVARWAIVGVGSPYKAQTFRLLAAVLFMSQLFVTVFSQNYKEIGRAHV